jgi:hypothetical protein
MMLRE